MDNRYEATSISIEKKRENSIAHSTNRSWSGRTPNSLHYNEFKAGRYLNGL